MSKNIFLAVIVCIVVILYCIKSGNTKCVNNLFVQTNNHDMIAASKWLFTYYLLSLQDLKKSWIKIIFRSVKYINFQNFYFLFQSYKSINTQIFKQPWIILARMHKSVLVLFIIFPLIFTMNPYNLIKEQRVLQKMKTMDESIEQTGIKEKINNNKKHYSNFCYRN